MKKKYKQLTFLEIPEFKELAEHFNEQENRRKPLVSLVCDNCKSDYLVFGRVRLLKSHRRDISHLAYFCMSCGYSNLIKVVLRKTFHQNH